MQNLELKKKFLKHQFLGRNALLSRPIFLLQSKREFYLALQSQEFNSDLCLCPSSPVAITFRPKADFNGEDLQKIKKHQEENTYLISFPKNSSRVHSYVWKLQYKSEQGAIGK